MELESMPGNDNRFILELTDEEYQLMVEKVDHIVKNIVTKDDVPNTLFTEFFNLRPEMIDNFKRDLIYNERFAVNLAIRGIIASNLRFTLFRQDEALKEVTSS